MEVAKFYGAKARMATKLRLISTNALDENPVDTCGISRVVETAVHLHPAVARYALASFSTMRCGGVINHSRDSRWETTDEKWCSSKRTRYCGPSNPEIVLRLRTCSHKNEQSIASNFIWIYFCFLRFLSYLKANN